MVRLIGVGGVNVGVGAASGIGTDSSKVTCRWLILVGDGKLLSIASIFSSASIWAVFTSRGLYVYLVASVMFC